MKSDKQTKKLKLGVLIYTYDRITDAMVNVDIIRSVWAGSGIFSDIKIVHAFNGEQSWYPKKYREDTLVRTKNPGHFQGAAELIDAGMKIFLSGNQDFDYIAVLAADTWLVDQRYLKKIFTGITKYGSYLATCPWGLPERNSIFDVGMAVDLFIINLKWTKKFNMFPIAYKEFKDRYGDLLIYHGGGNLSLEKLLFTRYVKATFYEFNDYNNLKRHALKKLYLLKERMPVHSHINDNGHWIRKSYWPNMGLLTHHDVAPKQLLLKKLKAVSGYGIDKYLKLKQ